MSAKTSIAAQQPAGRRTPLSLNPSKQITKQTVDQQKNDNNNQKTEAQKKESLPEKRLSTDKRQSMAEARKPSSSSDSKKSEEVKTKNDDTRKNQNGTSSNGVKDKDKQTTNGSANKLKTDSSSGSVTPKKEAASKTTEKKKENVTEVVVAKEIKNEESKNKNEDKNKKKEKGNEDGDTKKVKEVKDIKDDKTKRQDIGKKEKEIKDDNTKKQSEGKKDDLKQVVEKPSEEKKATVKSSDNSKIGENIEKKIVEKMDLDLSTVTTTTDDLLLTKETKSEEIKISKTPVKENKVEESTKSEKIKLLSPAEELDDVEMMEPLAFDAQPSLEISASSTPAKFYNHTDIYTRTERPTSTVPKSEEKPPSALATYTPDRKSCPRTFASISGRRTIRPIGDYAFSGNSHLRESYRKINTELDFTSSSLNVTVGSEVPNNESFSFFSRSRKRDRSSPTYQSTMEVHGDLSPKSPKRARIDTGMSGFFNAMASPITMLRARLSRATVQSTPKKQVETPLEEDIVENVSGISVEEDITTTEDLTVNPDSSVGVIAIEDDHKKCEEEPTTSSRKPAVSESDIKLKENIKTTESQTKKKCSIM